MPPVLSGHGQEEERTDEGEESKFKIFYTFIFNEIKYFEIMVQQDEVFCARLPWFNEVCSEHNEVNDEAESKGREGEC